MSDLTFDELHDAVLEGLSLDWKSGTVGFEIRVGGAHAGKWKIVGEGISTMTIPREHPWGPSVSIMKAEVSKLDGGKQELRLSMQSGDEISASGTTFRLTTR